MNLVIVTLTSLVLLFINDSKFIYQTSLILLVLIGSFFFLKNKSKKLYYIEKVIFITFSLYFFTYMIYIFNDQDFAISDIDHASRFILLIPLYFAFREIKSFSFVEKLIIFSSLFTSVFVVANFALFDVARSYRYSCISGAQVSLVLGSITLFILLGKKNLNVILLLSITVLFSFISVFLSETRGVIICIPFSITIVIYLRFNQIKFKYIVYTILLFAVTAYGLVQSVPSLSSRYSKTVENIKILDQSIKSGQFHGSSSITIRYNFIKYGILAFLEKPIFGSGRNGFRKEMVEKGYDEKYLIPLTHTHNQFVSDLLMRGLFGFLSTLIFMLILILIFLALRKHCEKEFSSYGIILILSYLMFFLTDSPFIGSMHATIFFVFCSFLFISLSLHKVSQG